MCKRDYTTELSLLLSILESERKVLLLQEKVESEQFWLAVMLDDWKHDRSYSLSQIREQRKMVQLWTKRLSEAKAKPAKNE